MMLKDYLGRDMSSCSSSGFQSFPRRQCCSSVRFLLESELRYPKKRLPVVPPVESKHSSSHESVIQRAAGAVIKVIKLISFSSSAPSTSSAQLTKQSKPSTFHLLRRGLSGKLLRRRASMKKHVESQAARLASFLQVDSPRSSNALLQLPPWPSDDTICQRLSADAAPEVCALESNEDSSKVSVEKVATPDASVGGEEDDRVSVTETSCTSEVWPRESKEQCSPISVLDRSFEDDEEASSPLNSNVRPLPGNTRNSKGRLKRNENPSNVEPVDLLERYVSTDSNIETIQRKRTEYRGLLAVHLNGCNGLHSTERELAKEIIDQEIRKLDPVNKVDKLLLEHFSAEIFIDRSRTSQVDRLYERDLALVWSWFNRKPHDLTLGWSVEGGRRAYLRDMEWNERWMKLEEEKANVALELEREAFKSLLEESIADFLTV